MIFTASILKVAPLNPRYPSRTKSAPCTTDATPDPYSYMPNQALEILLLLKEHRKADDGPIDQQSANY